MSLVTLAPTMTSREIAGLVDRDHEQVVIDIFEMLCSLEEDFFRYGEFSEPDGDAPRRLTGCFYLPGALVHLLAGSYGFDAGWALYDAWRDKEIEAAKKRYRASQDPREFLKSCAPSIRAAQAARRAATKTYIAFNPLTGLIKIGKARDPDRRLVEVGHMAGCVLKALLVIGQDVENQLHRKFSAIRTHGEWFKDDGEIRAYCAALTKDIQLPDRAEVGQGA